MQGDRRRSRGVCFNLLSGCSQRSLMHYYIVYWYLLANVVHAFIYCIVLVPARWCTIPNSQDHDRWKDTGSLRTRRSTRFAARFRPFNPHSWSWIVGTRISNRSIIFESYAAGTMRSFLAPAFWRRWAYSRSVRDDRGLSWFMVVILSMNNSMFRILSPHALPSSEHAVSKGQSRLVVVIIDGIRSRLVYWRIDDVLAL